MKMTFFSTAFQS